MRLTVRVLSFLLLFTFGVTAVAAQPSSPSSSFTALQSSATYTPTNPDPSSVVLKHERTTRTTLGVRTETLRQYTTTDALRINDSALQTASFDLSGVPSAPAPQSSNGTRTALYVIGGVLVVGGAVLGILALGEDGPDPIPAPPGRPQ